MFLANFTNINVSAAFVDIVQPGCGGPLDRLSFWLAPIIPRFKAPERFSWGRSTSPNHENISCSNRFAAACLDGARHGFASI
eukprot:358865-Pyramimonas_sp.AAC.1